MHCPECGEPINSYYNFCYHCGLKLKEENMNEKTFLIQIDKDQLTSLEEAVKAGKIKIASEAESSRFILRALINYHERMTMGYGPEHDHWKNGLEFALSCVEEKIQNQS